MIFCVGDKVRIREWDDMVAEFGLEEDNEIPCRATFIEDMREYCGREYTIDGIYGEDSDSCLVTFAEPDAPSGYTWSSDMIQISCPLEDKIPISSLEGLV